MSALPKGLAVHRHAVGIAPPDAGVRKARDIKCVEELAEIDIAQLRSGEGSVPGGEPANTPTSFRCADYRAGGSGRRPGAFTCTAIANTDGQPLGAVMRSSCRSPERHSVCGFGVH